VKVGKKKKETKYNEISSSVQYVILVS